MNSLDFDTAVFAILPWAGVLIGNSGGAAECLLQRAGSLVLGENSRCELRAGANNAPHRVP